MNISKFNNGDIFALDVYDAGVVALRIGHNTMKFCFCLGQMHYLKYAELKCLYANPKS